MVEPLIRALSYKEFDFRERAADSLGKIGNPKAIEPILKALFNFPSHPNLIGKYKTSLFLLISSSSLLTEEIMNWAVCSSFAFNDDSAIEAISNLCAINSSITSNILHNSGG